MKINTTLLTTLVLAMVVGAVLVRLINKVWDHVEAVGMQPLAPPGPVGFKALPASALV